MNINIFQFLKQGTSLSRDSLKKNKQLEQQIIPKSRNKNQSLQQIGKFHQSDSSLSDQEGFDEEQLKHSYNKRTQKNNKARKALQIKVEGLDIPDMMTNFTKLTHKYQIDDSLASGIAELGFTKPTPVQMQAIPALIQNRNTLVTAPTGTGKTVAFCLPIAHNFLKEGQSKQVYGIIVAPLQELSTQIMEQFSTLCKFIQGDRIKIQCISKLTDKQKQKIIANKYPGFNILVTTPLNFIKTFSEHRKILKNVKYLIMDECDKYFQESFIEQIRTIIQMFNSFKPVYGLFSATIQHLVEELLKTELLDYSVRIQVGGKNKVLQKIDQKIQFCTNEYGKVVYLKNIISEGILIPPAIIFVQEKKRAKQLFYQFKKINSNALLAGINISKKVQILTSDKSKEQRQEILDKFQSGQYWVLITTDIVARGIDFKTVNFVINYDFPNSILTYIHRVGRTGRANRKGKAVTLFTEEDKPVVRSLANLLKVSGCQVPQWILEMPNPSKQLKKKLEKYPVKRLPVGVAEGADKNWEKELDKLDKKWIKKKQKQAERQKQNGEDQEQWIQC